MFSKTFIDKLKTNFNDDLIVKFQKSDKPYIYKILIFKDKIMKSLNFEYDTKCMDSERFIEIKNNIDHHKKWLITNNKHRSTITIERYYVFIKDKSLANDLYNKMCSIKVKKMREIIEDNPILISSSLESMITKYGIIEGRKKYEEYREVRKTCSTRSLSGWIKKGYSEEEAAEMLKKQQATFSLEKCIDKYGKEDGVNIWKERQERWQKTLNSKNQEEIDRINLSKIKNRKSGPASKSETELYKRLSIHFPNTETQYIIRSEDGKRLIYDIRYKDKIIEYNGTYWHCDPRKYEENYFKKDSKLYAKDIWKQDKFKQNLAEKNGFTVLYIWELDYKENREKEIQKCIDFLIS